MALDVCFPVLDARTSKKVPCGMLRAEFSPWSRWGSTRDRNVADPALAGAMRVNVPVVPGAAPVFAISRFQARFNDLHTANHFTSACSAHVYRDDLFPVAAPATGYGAWSVGIVPPLPPTVLNPFRPRILFCTAIKPIVAKSNGTEKAAAISSRGGY